MLNATILKFIIKAILPIAICCFNVTAIYRYSC